MTSQIEVALAAQLAIVQPTYARPHTEQAIRRRRIRTLTITPSAVSLTPVTLAPGVPAACSIP